MTLTNETGQTQSVWFDKPKLNTGGPACTSVKLTNKATGKTVLKYENKAILNSQLYSTDQIRGYSYQLKRKQEVSGQFSLYDLVVLLDNKQKLDKGSYEMQIFYYNNSSDKLTFIVN